MTLYYTKFNVFEIEQIGNLYFVGENLRFSSLDSAKKACDLLCRKQRGVI